MPPSPPDNRKPRPITDVPLRRWRLPAAEGGDKESRGRVLVIAGALEMPGAAILAATAALRAGAGKVRVATAGVAALAVATAVPELFVLGIAKERAPHREASLRAVLESARTADAVLLGPGMRDVDAIRFLLPELLALDELRALIIDATAIPAAAGFLPVARGNRRGKTILTPHVAEMAALAKIPKEGVERDPEGVARDVARRLASVIVLKGAETRICAEDQPVYLNTRGNAGLATAGSGDVLAGIIAGLCARGAEPLPGAVMGVTVHARAGDRLAKRVGPLGYLAREILAEVPHLTRHF